MSHDLNFLAEKAPSDEKKKINQRRPLFIGLIVLGVLFFCFFIWTAGNAGLLVVSLLDGRDRLNEAKTAVENLSFTEAQTSLKKSESDLTKANNYLQRIKWLEILPWLGPQVKAADILFKDSLTLLNIVEKVTELGSDVVRLVGTAQEITSDTTEQLGTLRYDELSPSTKRLVLQRINGAAPDLALAAEQIGLIKNDLNDLKNTPSPLGEVVQKLDEMLSEADRVLSLFSIVSQIIPDFTGLDEEKRFLLLLENNSEMRPAGGFIGTYGIFRVIDGEIKELELKDSYLLDSVAAANYSAEPPAPLKKYLSTDQWYFRDSNWSPDFPTSARSAISLFTNEVLAIPTEKQIGLQEPVSFDGVIAFTPTFVAELLEITGPITLGDQVFSADNILDSLEYQVERGFQENGLPYEQRKDVITDLFNEIKTRIFATPLTSWGSVVKAMEDNLLNKQIVLFCNSSSETEDVLRQVNWGGVVEAAGGDFLMVVDANLASLKTDPKVKKEIAYTIKQSADGRFIGRTTISYNHQGIFDWKTTRYRTYTRVYVPRGSQLISSEGSLLDDKLKNPSGVLGVIDVGEELGATFFGTFISIEPGESRDLTFEYYLPSSVSSTIEAGSYFLDTVKQIGTADYPLTLELNFAKKVVGAFPAEEEVKWGDSYYNLETVLDSDKDFHIWF